MALTMDDFPTLGAPTKTTAGVSNLTAGTFRNDFCSSTICVTGGAATSSNSFNS